MNTLFLEHLSEQVLKHNNLEFTNIPESSENEPVGKLDAFEHNTVS